MDTYNPASGRYLYSIGPAPRGWQTIKNCSRVTPHDENDEQWMNDEMNADHYPATWGLTSIDGE